MGCDRDVVTVGLDRSTGRVTVTVAGPVVLESPPAGVWCRLVDRVAGLRWVDQFDGTVAELVHDMLVECGHPPVERAGWPLWFHDPTVVKVLLEHWRDWPYSPFTSRSDDTLASVDVGSPGVRALAGLYRACRGVLTPLEVRGLALWEIAALARRPDMGPADGNAASIVRRPDGRPSTMRWTKAGPVPPDQQRPADAPYHHVGAQPAHSKAW